MSITREYLFKEYKNVLSSPNDEEQFMEKCMLWLADADVHSCFKVLPFGDIKSGYLLKKTETKLGIFYDLEDALKNLEKYAKNLWKKPWCKAFHVIKIFNGFFKYKIEQWIPLDTVCKVLELMGYHKTSEGTFEIEKLDEERVLVVGLELYFAHTQLFHYRTKFSENYTVDNILEEWIHANGSSTKMLENVSFNKISPKVSEKSLNVTTKSVAITTATQHQYFDKNGLGLHVEQAHTEDKMHSLSTSRISDDQMYGDVETDADTQDHNGYLPSKQSFLNSHKYEENRAYTSMPFHSNRLDKYEHLQYYQSKHYLQELSAEELYGSSSEDTRPSMNKYKEDRLSNQSEKTKENMLAPVKPRASGWASHEHTNEENVDEISNRCQTILQARVLAGEKDLQQEQTKHVDEILIADNVTNLEQRCYICGNIAVITCTKCTETVCKVCFNISKRKPCPKENQHEFCTIKNNDSLYENLTSSQVHPDDDDERENKEDIFFNSPETLVCDSCSHSKNTRVQKIKAGENPQECNVCKMSGGTFV